MTKKSNAYFTRYGGEVHVRANRNFCAEGEEPLDEKVRLGGKCCGLSYDTLWDAGAGVIEISPKGEGQITEISEDQDDKIYCFLSRMDDCVWDSSLDDDPTKLIPFVKDFETSQANKGLHHDYEKYAIVNDYIAVKVGVHNKRPLNRIFDYELVVTA